MTHSPNVFLLSRERQQFAGLDIARLLAAAAVFFVHTCSLMDRDDLRRIAGFSIGRIGTSLFFMLSGFLVVSVVRTPVEVLRKRVCRIYPAFWVVVLFSFFAAAVTGYKSFDAWQVASQLAGTGFFTHPHSLVGVHTWFVSVLLLMYSVVYLSEKTWGMGSLVVIVLFLTVHFRTEIAILKSTTTHGLLFLAAYSVGNLPRLQWLGFAVIAAGFAGLSVSDPAFKNGAVAAFILALGRLWVGTCRPARWFAGYAYEWFLLHGIFLHAALFIFGRDSWLFVLPALIGTLMGAVLLRKGLDLLGCSLKPLAAGPKSRDDSKAIPTGAMIDTTLDLPTFPNGPAPCSASSETGRPSVTAFPAATS